MKLEDQVVSLELAKKLKEVGVKQESYFYWENETNLIHYEDIGGVYDIFSAFTVAELGELLPANINVGKKTYELELMKESQEWFINYSSYKNGDYNIFINFRNTLPNAMAEMLIHLVEHGLLKLPY